MSSKVQVKIEPESPKASSSRKLRSSRKRTRGTRVLSSSDVEILEPPAEAAKARKPRPGTPAFNLQSPVTITAKSPSKSVSRRLSFGEIDFDDADAIESSEKNEIGKRIRKPSWKVREATCAPVSDTINEDAPAGSLQSAQAPAAAAASVRKPSRCVGVPEHASSTAATEPSLDRPMYSDAVSGLPSKPQHAVRLTVDGNTFSEEDWFLSDHEIFPNLPTSSNDRDSQLSDYSLRRRSSSKVSSSKHKSQPQNNRGDDSDHSGKMVLRGSKSSHSRGIADNCSDSDPFTKSPPPKSKHSVKHLRVSSDEDERSATLSRETRRCQDKKGRRTKGTTISNDSAESGDARRVLERKSRSRKHRSSSAVSSDEQAGSPPPSRKGKGKPRAHRRVSSSDSMADFIVPDDTVDVASSPLSGQCSRRRSRLRDKRKHSKISSDEDVNSSTSESSSDDAPRKSGRKSSRHKKTKKDPIASSDSDSDVDRSNRKSHKYTSKSTKSSSKRRELSPSPELVALHKRFPTLPRLFRFAILLPFRRLQKDMQFAGNQNQSLLQFAPTLDGMDDDIHARLLRRAQKFVQHGVYANPALVDPNLFALNGAYIVWKSSRANAVFVSPGAVAECNIIDGARHGGGEGYLTKKLSLFPFEENHDRSISFFGSLCNFDEVYSHFVGGTICLATMKQGAKVAGTAYKNNIASPSPKKPGLFSTTSATYPAALKFEDHVPIYDGRQTPFRFTAENFASISSLPLYKSGRKELPPYAVVAVGYTFNTFGQLDGLCASFNIMFVVYLGKTGDDKKSA